MLGKSKRIILDCGNTADRISRADIMLRQESMSAKMAKVTVQIDARGGTVDEAELDRILRGFGVVRQAANYRAKLVEYGYLNYDRGYYHLSAESQESATITIIVTPSLYGEEVRRHLVETLAGYPDLIEVSDVSI